MKAQILLVSGILAMGTFMACSGPKGDKAQVTEADTIIANTEGADKYEIDPSSSVVEWIGYKPTGEHNGTLNVKSGALFLKEGIPVSGEFLIDMQSIKVLDLEDPEWNGKLTGHLKSPDFFDIENHAESKFVITQIVKNTASSPAFLLTGNLTIKNITKSVTFGVDIKPEGDNVAGNAPKFTIDRTDFDIQYKSKKFFEDLKDDFINDEFTLAITLNGKKAI